MASSLEDFVKRLVRVNRKITFVFTEDFFNVISTNGLMAERYRDIRRSIKYVDHRKGERAELAAADPTKLFDVEVSIIRSNFTCYMTNFKELSTGPFGDGALIPGYGHEIVDSDKAKSQLLTFFAEKDEQSITVTNMLNDRRKRQLVLVVEKPSDLKRPSLEPIRALRSRLQTILISPVKGPIVDCQVAAIFQEGNSSSFSSLMSHFCVMY
jgi:hypothetical protein